MNKILSNIRSVPGVWGTIAIDKKRALTYQLLPASYEADAVKSIAIPTLNLAQTCERPMVVDIFFERGKARLYNRGEVVVLILGREEMSFDALGVVCKEAIQALCRRFSRGAGRKLVYRGGSESGEFRSPVESDQYYRL